MGYMDAAGNTVIAPRFSSGLEFLERGGHQSYAAKSGTTYDYFGEIAFPGEFGNAERFSEGRAYVIAAPRKYGYVDLSGRIVGEAKYRWAGHFAEGLAGVYSGNTLGSLIVMGPRLSLCSLRPCTASARDLPLFVLMAKWGYINRDGDIVIPFQLEQPFASPFRNGLAPVKGSGDLTGFMNRGQRPMAIQSRFQFTYGFTEGLASVQIDGRWGYIDAGGNLVILLEFDWAYPLLSDGLAAVTVNGPEPHIGFIDRYRGVSNCSAFQAWFPFS